MIWKASSLTWILYRVSSDLNILLLSWYCVTNVADKIVLDVKFDCSCFMNSGSTSAMWQGALVTRWVFPQRPTTQQSLVPEVQKRGFWLRRPSAVWRAIYSRCAFWSWFEGIPGVAQWAGRGAGCRHTTTVGLGKTCQPSCLTFPSLRTWLLATKSA